MSIRDILRHGSPLPSAETLRASGPCHSTGIFRYARAFRLAGVAAVPFMILVFLVLPGCGGDADSDVAEVIRGRWKNGDGSLMRFMEDGRAAIGQEGLEGEGDCEFEVEGDSVRLTTLPESPGDPRNIFEFHYSGDTLYMTAVTLLRPGERTRFSQDELPALLGKPMYKLHFTRIEETP